MAITPAQRRDFEALGWFHLGCVFTPSELSEIRDEYDRILSRPMRLQEVGKTAFEYSPLLHIQSEKLCAFATSSPYHTAATSTASCTRAATTGTPPLCLAPSSA